MRRSESGPLTQANARRNHLLAGLENDTLSAVLACARHVSLLERAPMYEAGDPITFVDFPLSGLISVLAISRAGGAVEVRPIGCDGMVGLSVFFGGESDPLEAFAQVPPVEVARIPVAAFRTLVERCPELQRIMRLYVQWSLYGMAQSVLCARLHPLEERLGCCLLKSHDRVGHDQFALRHDDLAEMLGVRRASVTIAAGVLRRSGLIEYDRGLVTILDRPRLEHAACECNGATAAEYRRLIGRGPAADRVPVG